MCYTNCIVRQLNTHMIKVVIGAILILIVNQSVYIFLSEFPQFDFGHVISRSYLDDK